MLCFAAVGNCPRWRQTVNLICFRVAERSKINPIRDASECRTGALSNREPNDVRESNNPFLAEIQNDLFEKDNNMRPFSILVIATSVLSVLGAASVGELDFKSSRRPGTNNSLDRCCLRHQIQDTKARELAMEKTCCGDMLHIRWSLQSLPPKQDQPTSSHRSP